VRQDDLALWKLISDFEAKDLFSARPFIVNGKILNETLRHKPSRFTVLEML